nr:MAG TPA: hypothetical protein [Caudoviricetes sp.]
MINNKLSFNICFATLLFLIVNDFYLKNFVHDFYSKI